MAGPLFGQTASAATPAAAAGAMPRGRGAVLRWGDVASLAYVAEVEGEAGAHDRHRACRAAHLQHLRHVPEVRISTQTKRVEHPVDPRTLSSCGAEG